MHTLFHSSLTISLFHTDCSVYVHVCLHFCLPVCVLVGAIAGIVDQPMQTFTRSVEAHSTAASTARGVISGVGKGIVGIFTKPIGGAAEFVSQTGYGVCVIAVIFEVLHKFYRCLL